ncbi:hypothetical protein [Thomasclavelia saccharogumia]|uniref:hypothetical protein n=1 Tax=Thomasclavelia saccharogumia TaxID=341225 RepID=UPI000AAE805A|nr:hypothetical protein [Thomasclavelia saccharogumia]
MKKLLGVATSLAISVINVRSLLAYNGSENTNLSGGKVLLFIPIMLGIVYLANKSEVK